MGLDICLGVVEPSEGPEDVDEETAEWAQECIAAINTLLTACALSTYEESPAPRPDGNRSAQRGFPYSSIHYLRRIAAQIRVDPARSPGAAAEDEDPSEDPAYVAELERCASHLICHSDTEGYYVPIDFPRPLSADPDGALAGFLGSSQGLMRELVAVAPALGIALADGELPDSEAARINQRGRREAEFSIERSVWLGLFEAARLSVKHGVAIVFC